MNIRRDTPLMLPLLALGLAFAFATTAQAQDRHDAPATSASATLQVRFGTAPHWTAIAGMQVQELPTAERPAYDMFRYGDHYYAYDHDRWYMSPRESGDFTVIDDHQVPSQFNTIPRDHWRSYPSAWQNTPSPVPTLATASLRVQFGTTPHWNAIAGIQVDELPAAERPDYDIFRYAGNYYAYDQDRWYTSTSESGDFAMIDGDQVPSQLNTIPRDHWRNYPSTWQSAPDQRPVGSAASLQVRFGTAPHWSGIAGLSVQELPTAERQDYDMFRYDGHYYAYDHDRWFMSANEQGDYSVIDEHQVPSEFNTIPRSHWRSYPSSWSSAPAPVAVSTTLQVNFGTKPHWDGIPGTHVKEVREGARQDYDMFRFDGNFYAYDNDRWYTSRHDSGEFTMIGDDAVPNELSTVPRGHWRNYPSGWLDQDGNPRHRERSPEHSKDADGRPSGGGEQR